MSVLAALATEPTRAPDGREILESIFANEDLPPVLAHHVCDGIRELEALGLARVNRKGLHDPDYDFAVAQPGRRFQAGRR